MQPLILITNDDGIRSPGLWAAAEAVSGLGELLIVAPIEQQTGMGRSFPKGETAGRIEIVRIPVGDKMVKGYGVHGSPAQAVAHAVLELCSRKPDLCISGINYGENLGLSLTCSGTLGAAFEADSHDIFSIAVSRQAELGVQNSEDFMPMDWTPAMQVTKELACNIIKNGRPDGISIFNVNVPEGAAPMTERRITRQSRQNYSVFQKPGSRDMGQHFRLTSRLDVDRALTGTESDVYAFYFDKVISITPLSWELTAKTDWQL